MFEQIKLTIGHNVQGVPTHEIGDVCRMVEAFLGVDAYTAIPCYGMWRGEAEASTRVEIVTDPASARIIRDNVAHLAHALDQEAIMCQCAGSVEFIEAQTPALARIAA